MTDTPTNPSLDGLYDWLGTQEDSLFRQAREARGDFTLMQSLHIQSNVFAEWRRELRRAMVMASCQSQEGE